MNTLEPAAVTAWDTGTNLRGVCCVPEHPAAVVLVVHGFGEHAGRHAATMQTWSRDRIATYAYDQRSHGASPGTRAVFERFDDFVDDSLALRERVAAAHPGLPLFLFGVSMGGVVAARSAERRPEGLRGVVLLAPAFAIAEHIPGFVRTLLGGVRKIAPRLTIAPPLALANLSRDPAVNAAYGTDPLTHHGGVALCSVLEFAAAGDAAIADATSYRVPTLILQGDADKIVFPIGATRFKDAVPAAADVTLTVVPGGFHELFNDPGSEALVAAAAAWIAARS